MTKFLLRTLEALILVCFLAAAFLAWRLSHGPLPLDPLAPYIEKALTNGQPDLRLTIGNAMLNWRTLDTRPMITVENVQAIDRSGVIAALPRMDVQVSLPALLKGAFAPEEIALSSPSLRVTRRVDGRFAFGMTEAPSPSANIADNESVARALVAALSRPAGEFNPAGYLKRVSVRDSTLVVLDEATGERWLVPNAGLVLQRAGAGADVEFTATLPVIDANRPWNIAVKGRYAAASHEIALSLKLNGFRPAGIADLAQQLYPLRAVDLALNGEVTARFALAEQAATMEQVTFDLHGEDGTVHLPQPLDHSYAIKSLAAKGDITDALDHIRLQSLRIALNEGAPDNTVMQVAGEGVSLNTAPTIGLDIDIDNLTIEALKSYWPEGAKENARRWVAANLNDGRMSQSHFHIGLGGSNLDELKLTELKGTSILEGVAVTYMKTLPPIEGTNGVLSMAPSEVSIALSDGHVADPQSGKGLRVRGGNVRMSNLGSDHERAQVALTIGGDLGEVMRLIDHPPLGYATAMNLDPTTLTGNTAIDLNISFPLINDVKLDQIQIDAKAKVLGAKIPSAVFNQPVEDSDLSLTLDRRGMDVNGTVVLGGISASLAWRENFGGGEFRSRYDIDTILGNAQRKLVALTSPAFAPPYIDGPVRAHVVYTAYRDGHATIDADANLHGATLAIPQAGWTKAADEEAHARVSAILQNDEIKSVPSFHLVSGDSGDLAGSAQFGPGDTLTKMTITTARLGETDLAGEMMTDDAGMEHVELRGAAFDAVAFLKELNRKSDDAAVQAGADQQAVPKTPLELHATVDRMWLSKDGDFRNVHLIFRQDTKGVQNIDFTTMVDGTAPFTFTLGLENGKRAFHGISDSGGSVIRAVGLFDDIVGGRLKIDGDVAPDDTVTGRVDITNLKLVRAPPVARLLSVAALTGIVDELRGKGISFKLMRAPFSYKQSVVRISNGEMFGTSLGLTAKGSYDFASRHMDFDGTIIPAYAINNVLSSVPLIGPLLTGTEKGGGILAASYSYHGDPDTAQPSVNPLSVLAPGIMRRIFDIFKGPPAQSAQNPQGSKEPPPVAKPDSSDAITEGGSG